MQLAAFEHRGLEFQEPLAIREAKALPATASPLLGIIDLCVGCGACEGVCLQNAISFELNRKDCIYKPTVDMKRCNFCMNCARVCPSLGSVSGMRNCVSAIGEHLAIFNGFANEYAVQRDGASGGIVTALLLFVLEHKLVDKVIVSKMSGRARTQSLMTDSKNLILSSQGSIYFQTMPCRLIKRMLGEKDRRYAVVGLPCQIWAFREAAKLFPSFPKENCLYIGLVCNHINTWWYLGYFLKHWVGKAEIAEISPRKGPWPGNITVRTEHNSVSVPHYEFWEGLPSLYLSSPVGCLTCPDIMNRFADVSVGDAKLACVRAGDRLGTSAVIVRSRAGMEILDKARAEHAIRIWRMTQLHPDSARTARRGWLMASVCRLALAGSIFRAIRMHGLQRTTLSMLTLGHSLASRHGLVRKLLNYCPRVIVRTYDDVLWKLVRRVFS